MSSQPDKRDPFWMRYETGDCPLCGRPQAVGELYPLYETAVCGDCRAAFARKRMAAFLIDLVSLVIIGNAFEWVLLSLGVEDDRAEPVAAVSIVVLLFLKDGFAGMSPGKWLLGLQVVDAKTLHPAGFWASFKRNLVFLLSWIAVLLIWVDLARGLRWGDRWAGTMVIWRKYADRLPCDRPFTLCRGCRYDLTGNVSGVCPECGLAIPDHDRKAIAAKSVPPIRSDGV